MSIKPNIDPQQRKELVEEATHGIDPGSYSRVMEHHGFAWYQPQFLPPGADGLPPKEGQWRHAGMGFGFTPNDLMAHFRGPQDFHEWIEGHKLKARMRAAGLVSV